MAAKKSTLQAIQIKAGTPSESKLTFSFAFLRFDHSEFAWLGREPEYFAKLLERLKELSTWTRRRFVTNYEKSWRIHQIDWALVSQDSFCTGLRVSPVEEHDLAAWQFALSSNEHGRVHGFLIADTFYLVWLDPDHRLYAAK